MEMQPRGKACVRSTDEQSEMVRVESGVGVRVRDVYRFAQRERWALACSRARGRARHRASCAARVQVRARVRMRGPKGWDVRD